MKNKMNRKIKGIDVVQEINKILEEESYNSANKEWQKYSIGNLPKGLDVESKLNIAAQTIGLDLVGKNIPMEQEDYNLLMDKYDRNEIQPINEPYTYKDTSEYKKSDKVIQGTWKPSNSDEITMEFNLDYIPDPNMNIRPEYADLISNMWKAKHRNEIICNEILNK